MINRRTKKGRADSQERRVAKRVNARVQPGSGSSSVNRNDSVSDNLLVENKGRTRVDAKQITLKLVDLQQLQHNAAVVDRVGVLSFELGGEDWFVLSEVDFCARFG